MTRAIVIAVGLLAGLMGAPALAGPMPITGTPDKGVTAAKLADTLTLVDGKWWDLSAINHSTNANEGLVLPNCGAAPTDPASAAEGFVCYDQTGDQLLINTGAAWVSVGTAYTAGDGLTLTGTDFDLDAALTTVTSLNVAAGTLSIGNVTNPGAATLTINSDALAAETVDPGILLPAGDGSAVESWAVYHDQTGGNLVFGWDGTTPDLTAPTGYTTVLALTSAGVRFGGSLLSDISANGTTANMDLDLPGGSSVALTSLDTSSTWNYSTGNDRASIANDAWAVGFVANHIMADPSPPTGDGGVVGFVSTVSSLAPGAVTTPLMAGFVSNQQVSSADDVVTNEYGLLVLDTTGTGTLTNQYGVDIRRQVKGGTLNRAIQADPNQGTTMQIAAASALPLTAAATLVNLDGATNVTLDGNTMTALAIDVPEGEVAINVTDGFIQSSVNAGLTAVSPGAQGDGALTAEVNEVSTVGVASDAVTLPAAVAGRRVVVINNGANTLEIWPASGDNLGAGVNTATTLAAGSNVHYVAYDATNWETL